MDHFLQLFFTFHASDENFGPVLPTLSSRGIESGCLNVSVECVRSISSVGRAWCCEPHMDPFYTTFFASDENF